MNMNSLLEMGYKNLREFLVGQAKAKQAHYYNRIPIPEPRSQSCLSRKSQRRNKYTWNNYNPKKS